MTTDTPLMTALTFDREREDWHCSTGLIKEKVPRPVLTDDDRNSVIIRVQYAGFCGSDRGIWWRKAFGDMIIGSLDDTQSDKRIVGHELLGEVVELGLMSPEFELEIVYLRRATSFAGCAYNV